jgi:hypothetical protein
VGFLLHRGLRSLRERLHENAPGPMRRLR